ncbi:MAG: cytidylate kinase-like family protein [Thermodesulfobacteriota bacterium]|nr:cytidylate kinase-like family protein [Thermodesulfobacteriota bacterium]
MPVINNICFSRQIGVGALEIADILSDIINFKVIDREVLEHMAKDAHLTQKAIEFYDERYQGKMSEFLSILLSEKTFLKSDYARQLTKTVSTLGRSASTIFVGRGTHLILPRKNILAVRFVGSWEFRVERLAKIMDVSKTEADVQLNIIDSEQLKFFKTVFQTDDQSPDAFDLVINREHLRDASQAAEIVACAFKQKFAKKKTGSESDK